MRHKLFRSFTKFPGGLAGVALLLLRAALGSAAFTLGGTYLSGGVDSNLWSLIVGPLSIVCGLALLIGLLTPLFSVLICVSAIIITISPFQLLTHNATGYNLSAPYTSVIAIAVLLLGPGAFSFDARLFGRREIIIPDNSSLPTS